MNGLNRKNKLAGMMIKGKFASQVLFSGADMQKIPASVREIFEN